MKVFPSEVKRKIGIAAPWWTAAPGVRAGAAVLDGRAFDRRRIWR
jgi:hypothetical protein